MAEVIGIIILLATILIGGYLFFIRLKESLTESIRENEFKTQQSSKDLKQEIIKEISQSQQSNLRDWFQYASNLDSQNFSSLTHQIGSLPISDLSSKIENCKANIQNLASQPREVAALRQQISSIESAQLIIQDSIHKLEGIILGSASKGQFGESIIYSLLSQIPADWQVRNFTVKGKPVEFGVRFDNGLILPIDSKFPATNLIEQYKQSKDTQEKKKLLKQIHTEVEKKALELKKYIDVSVTTPYAVAIVPDGVFSLCGAVQSEVFKHGVILISYSMLLPFLLLAYNSNKATETIDIEKIINSADQSVKNLDLLLEELDGRMSRAITMIGNSRDELKTEISKVRSNIFLLTK